MEVKGSSHHGSMSRQSPWQHEQADYQLYRGRIAVLLSGSGGGGGGHQFGWDGQVVS